MPHPFGQRLFLATALAALCAAPAAARPAPFHWEKIHVSHLLPSTLFVKLGLTHITRNGDTRDGRKGVPDPHFPPGLTDVVPYDAERLLLARGTAEGLSLFRLRVNAADVARLPLRLTATLTRRQGADDLPVGTAEQDGLTDGVPTELHVGDGDAARVYQIKIRANADGSYWVACRASLPLPAPLDASAPAIADVFVPDRIWTAPLSLKVREGEAAAFPDLASSRRAAARKLAAVGPDTPDDYTLRVTLTPQTAPPAEPSRGGFFTLPTVLLMHPSLLPLLASPETGGPLTLTAGRAEGEDVLTGSLRDGAGHVYPIEDGIPRLLPLELLDAQRSEIAARDAQVEDYDRMAFLNWFGRVEIPLTLRALSPARGDLLLEAGCGTGRMTATLARAVRSVVAIDFSFESLRVARRKLAATGIGNVHLVQADLCRLPFADAAFDRIVSCQVLEHVPGPDARRAAVSGLARTVKPGGTLALSAYKHSLLTRCFGQKEGTHDGGIPFFRFSRAELRETLAAGFQVQSVTGALVYLYLARCLRA